MLNVGKNIPYMDCLTLVKYIKKGEGEQSMAIGMNESHQFSRKLGKSPKRLLTIALACNKFLDLKISSEQYQM